MAAYEITLGIEEICYYIAEGFGIATAAIVAQELGAKPPTQATTSSMIATGLAVCCLSLGSLLCLAIPEGLLGIFSKDTAIIAAAVPCLYIAAVAQPFMAMSMAIEVTRGGIIEKSLYSSTFSALSAAFMDRSSIEPLLEDLKNPTERVRERATQELWRIWFHQKGVYGLDFLQRAQLLLDRGNLKEAEAVLTELIEDQPDFAEAWNRRAVLYYSMGDYYKAIEDCLVAIELNPVHFGALHGLGLCYATLGKYREAIQAFQQALAIQPFALINQRLILECTARLS